MSKIATAVLIVVIGWSIPAKGQTAEETVLFMLLGIENGAVLRVRDRDGSYVYKRLSKNAFAVLPTAADDDLSKIRWTTTIEQASPCTYKITTSGLEQREETFDFSELMSYEVADSGHTISLTFRRLGASHVGGPILVPRTIPTVTSADRLRRAGAHFRTFCAGRAF